MANDTQVLDPAVLDPAVLDPAVIEPAATETLDPVVEEPLDPITGLAPEQDSSPNTSNDNQVYVNSNIDQSVNTFYMHNYTSTQSQENLSFQETITSQESLTTQAMQPSNEPSEASIDNSQPSAELMGASSDDFNCSVSSSRIGRIYRFDSRRYFRGGRKKARVDRITNFSSEAGDGMELSRKAFKGIGELDFTTASNKRSSKRAARTDTDIIYNESSGKLYFNANDDSKGFGKKGGLFAILESSPLISSSDITII